MRRFIILISALIYLSAVALEQSDSTSIITSLASGQSSITVKQPPSMNDRVSYGSKVTVEIDKISDTGRTSRRGGFRVQIFSDNNVRTAKSNAEYRKRTVEQRLPGVRAYLKYESPYWRVQVGDYRTRAEAENALQELRNAFPSYASDLKIVSERINVTQ